MQGQGGPMWGSTKQGRAFPSGDPKPCPCLQTRRRGAALPKAPGAAALGPGPTPSAARYRRARYLLDFGWSLGWWSGVFWLPDKVLMKNSLRNTRHSAMNISGFVQNNREGVRGRMHRRGEEGARQQLPSRCSVRPRFVETGSEEGPHSTVLQGSSPSSLPGARTISIKGRETDRGPGLSHRMAAGTRSAQPQSPPGAAPCSYVAIGIRQETILPPPVSPLPRKTENEPLSLWSVIQSHGAAPHHCGTGTPKPDSLLLLQQTDPGAARSTATRFGAHGALPLCSCCLDGDGTAQGGGQSLTIFAAPRTGAQHPPGAAHPLATLGLQVKGFNGVAPQLGRNAEPQRRPRSWRIKAMQDGWVGNAERCFVSSQCHPSIVPFQKAAGSSV